MDDVSTIPDLLLEQLALDELPLLVEVEVRRRLLDDPVAADRLARLAASDAAILATYPPGWVANKVRRRVARATSEGRGRPADRRAEPASLPLRWIPALAAAVMAAWLVLLPAGPEAPAAGGRALLGPEAEDWERAKGRPRLLVHRQRRRGPERLSDGARVHAGDLVQLGYVAAGARHGVILSVDGRGRVTLHHPQPGGSTALTGGGLHHLPLAYELDDAPRFERFLFVTGDAPIDVRATLRAARGLGRGSGRSLRLPAGLQVTERIVAKPGGRR